MEQSWHNIIGELFIAVIIIIAISHPGKKNDDDHFRLT